jgi:hypothetical protein
MNMKKFRLKPLGELWEKFSMNWFFIGLLTLCVSACSDDDDDVVPTFPEKQTINTEANKTHELTFDAATNWQLTTSATWCRFVVDGGEEFSLSGGAGKQTITLKVTDEAQSAMEKTMAQVTLAMGNERAIIANVVRSVKGFELKIYDEEGNEIQEITAGYKEYKSFVVKANFHFAATNRPEWAEIQGGAIVGSATKEVTAGVQIVNEAKYAKYEQKGKITFADDKGLYAIDIPLVYNGMNRDEIEISGPSAWNWEVSLDGQTFTQTSNSGITGSTTSSIYNDFVPFTIQAYADDFVIVYVEEKQLYPGSWTFWASSEEDGDIDWMHIKRDDKNKSNVRIMVDAAEQEQKGTILAFPRAVYNQIKGNDLLDNLTDSEYNPETSMFNREIKYIYEQENMLIKFTQKEKKENEEKALKITDQSTGADIAYTELTGDDAAYYSSEYGAKGVYTINSERLSSTILIDSYIELDNYALFYGDDNITESNSELDENTPNRIAVWGFADLTKELVVVMRNATWSDIKVLVIRP